MRTRGGEKPYLDLLRDPVGPTLFLLARPQYSTGPRYKLKNRSIGKGVCTFKPWSYSMYKFIAVCYN